MDQAVWGSYLYFLTGQHLLFNIGGLVVVSLLVLALSLKLWKWGLDAYESAGS
ncbi:ABC-2 family transporter domain protein [Streptococcus pyogenes GA40884]|nr:ABC-2 family transporter domain protein [Streptococcus pyogenes GA40884]